MFMIGNATNVYFVLICVTIVSSDSSESASKTGKGGNFGGHWPLLLPADRCGESFIRQ